MNTLRRSRLLRAALIVIGWLSVALGVLGIFLPLLPTTPFLLLASACFVRSSPRFHHWLTTHRYFGPYLNFYLSGKGIPRRAKIAIIAMLWLTITPSALLFVPWRWLSLLMLVGALGMSVYIARQPEPLIVRDETP